MTNRAPDTESGCTKLPGFFAACENRGPLTACSVVTVPVAAVALAVIQAWIGFTRVALLIAVTQTPAGAVLVAARLAAR